MLWKYFISIVYILTVYYYLFVLPITPDIKLMHGKIFKYFSYILWVIIMMFIFSFLAFHWLTLILSSNYRQIIKNVAGVFLYIFIWANVSFA